MAEQGETDPVVKSEDYAGFLEEFDDESDRAAAILGAAFVGEVLRGLIADFLIDNHKVDELLEGPLAPLGSFASRTAAAYCMGLIGEDEFHDLQIIRQIRNRFAHKLHGLSFADAWVAQKCDALDLPKTAPQWPVHGPARGAFSVAIALLIFELLRRAAEHSSERRTVPAPFYESR